MIHRLRDVMKYWVERALVRGPLPRLLVIAILIALVSLVAGVLVYVATPGFRSLGDALWWAFLRLSDPGYLGDDQGALKRAVSTVVTILGYVLFMGSLVAIMTQWLMQTLRNLERGLTPIVARDHIVILGWSNHTVAVLQELLGSEGRMRRFLQLRGTRQLRVAVLADEVSPELLAELRDRLGRRWNPRQVILRSGDPLRLEHLRRVDFDRAAAILLPAGEGRQDAVDADTRAIKTIMTIASEIDPSSASAVPLIAAEIHDAREIPIASRLYKGPAEVIASGQLVGRLIAQTVRNPGLSHVYGELLQHDEKNELYLRAADDLVGATIAQLFDAFPEAVPIGLISHSDGRWVPHLGLAGGQAVAASDRLVLVARSYNAASLLSRPLASSEQPSTQPAHTAVMGSRPARRVLLLGWNRRAPSLLCELDRFPNERFEITVTSLATVEERQQVLEGADFRGQRVVVEHKELDSTNLSHLRRLIPGSFDSIVLMASERAESEAESDARTILCYLLLRDIVAPSEPTPKVLVELVDPQNAELFESRAAEVIVSSLVVSHMLAQVALRRELRVVFDELFGAAGPEITFRPASQLELAGKVSFAEIQQQTACRLGEIVVGIKTSSGVRINPPHDEHVELAAEDELIVVC